MNHLENLKLALRKWQEVPPDMVDLDEWTTKTRHACGTLHCFGGWLATWPEFQAMGVYPSSEGAPRMLSDAAFTGYVGSAGVGAELFGTRGMFSSATDKEESQFDNHWLIVRNRLLRAIENLENQNEPSC